MFNHLPFRDTIISYEDFVLFISKLSIVSSLLVVFVPAVRVKSDVLYGLVLLGVIVALVFVLSVLLRYQLIFWC